MSVKSIKVELDIDAEEIVGTVLSGGIGLVTHYERPFGERVVQTIRQEGQGSDAPVRIERYNVRKREGKSYFESLGQIFIPSFDNPRKHDAYVQQLKEAGAWAA